MISSWTNRSLFEGQVKKVIALLLLTAPVPGMASPASEVDAAVSARYSAGYHQCIDGQTSDFAMTACTRAEHQRQDASLNRVYRTLLGRLSRPRAAQLRASQRAWIRSRNEYCLRQTGAPMKDWGTKHRLDYSSCLLDRTIRRTVWLERYRDGRARLSDLL